MPTGANPIKTSWSKFGHSLCKMDHVRKMKKVFITTERSSLQKDLENCFKNFYLDLPLVTVLVRCGKLVIQPNLSFGSKVGANPSGDTA
jgi:hypothetical protein